MSASGVCGVSCVYRVYGINGVYGACGASGVSCVLNKNVNKTCRVQLPRKKQPSYARN